MLNHIFKEDQIWMNHKVNGKILHHELYKFLLNKYVMQRKVLDNQRQYFIDALYSIYASIKRNTDNNMIKNVSSVGNSHENKTSSSKTFN